MRQKAFTLLYGIFALMLTVGGSSLAASQEAIVLQIGYENHPGEPVDLAINHWKDLVEERGDGSLRIEVFPSSQLGSKSDLTDMMVAGDAVCTLLDGTIYADRGVPDCGILYGPYLFSEWDECWNLFKSEWWAEQKRRVSKTGVTVLADNWMYGDRHTLTTRPVNSIADLQGMKIRVPSNTIQLRSWMVLGAAPTPMPLGDVYTSLQQGVIDGVENPLPVLYNGRFHEVAKYLLLDGHIKNITNWCVGTSFFESLTPEQQDLLVSTGLEAGLFNNKLFMETEAEVLEKLKAEGVTVVEPSAELKNELVQASQAFYQLPEFTSRWSDNLYETVKQNMK